jgi:hypothetical protein
MGMPSKSFYKKLAEAREENTIFVSYFYTVSGGGWTYGNTTQFKTQKNRITVEELRDIEKEIKKNVKATSVVVINYQIM